MRIELPTIASHQRSLCSDGTVSQKKTSLFHSSLRPSSARRGIPFLRAGWIMIKKAIFSFLAKLLSWFQYEEEKPYFKMKDPVKGEVTFYVCKDGRRTCKNLAFGLTQARLMQVSFSDPDLRTTLKEIVAREQIDKIIVTNFRYAKMLWDCGMIPTNAMVFKPEGQDPFNQRFLEMLKCAFSGSNPDTALLLEVQKEIVESIITDAIAPIPDALIIPDQADEIDIELAKTKIQKVGEVIGHPIELEMLMNHVRDEYLKKTIEKIKAAQSKNEKVSMDEISLSFSHIFGLMNITGLNFDGIIVPKVPEIIFTT